MSTLRATYGYVRDDLTLPLLYPEQAVGVCLPEREGSQGAGAGDRDSAFGIARVQTFVVVGEGEDTDGGSVSAEDVGGRGRGRHGGRRWQRSLS